MSKRSLSKHKTIKRFFLDMIPPKPKRKRLEPQQWPDTQLFQLVEEYRDQRR